MEAIGGGVATMIKGAEHRGTAEMLVGRMRSEEEQHHANLWFGFSLKFTCSCKEIMRRRERSLAVLHTDAAAEAKLYLPK